MDKMISSTHTTLLRQSLICLLIIFTPLTASSNPTPYKTDFGTYTIVEWEDASNDNPSMDFPGMNIKGFSMTLRHSDKIGLLAMMNGSTDQNKGLIFYFLTSTNDHDKFCQMTSYGKNYMKWRFNDQIVDMVFTCLRRYPAPGFGYPGVAATREGSAIIEELFRKATKPVLVNTIGTDHNKHTFPMSAKNFTVISNL